MEPGVPFALLAATQLLAVGAYAGFAGVAARPPVRRRGRSGAAAAGVLVVGALTVAAADAVTGARLGPSTDDVLVAVQAAGLVVLAAGLALRRAPAGPAALSVAPLGAAVAPSAVGVAGGLLAAALVWRQRDLPRLPLALGLLATGGALAAAPAARSHAEAALVLLAARGLGAAAVLVAIGSIARTSVLAKVVTAIGVGVLATAIGTAAVVGTVVANQLTDDQARQLRQAAVGAQSDLDATAATAGQLAKQAAACPAAQLFSCAQGIASIAPSDAFAVVVGADGAVRFAGGADRLDQDPAALVDLAGSAAVRDARAPVPNHTYDGYGFVLLHGRATQLVALGVSSASGNRGAPVVVYGVQVDAALLAQIRARSTFDATVLELPSGAPLASSLPAGEAGGLAAAARPLLASVTEGGGALSRIGQGSTPSAAYVLLPSGTQRIGMLALSGSGASVLRSQRTVLGLLFTALLVIGALVAVAAYVLGRRAVEPVRRLTVAARRVGDGDLTVRPESDGVDEVGELATVFRAMTVSLQYLTDDLRTTAETEAATRERLATVIDAMADALVVTGPDGTVELANPAATALFGPLAGRRADVALVDLDGAPLRPGEAYAAGRQGAVPVAVARADLPGGRGTVLVVRDVTARRQLEQAKTEFLSNVSHELRTPLTPIQGYADLLRRRPDLPPSQVQTMAESIGDGARRMARVVGLLVDVAALDAGRVRPAPEPVRPGAFLDARIAAWRERAPDADLRRRVSAGTPDLLVDPEWLARAVDELIDNARYHGGTPVTLLAAPGEEGRAVLSVRDTGPGLDPDRTAALFDDFAQLDGSATRTREGLGLGLAFVQRVSVVLGARISVTSRPGAGAVFSLELPVVVPAPGGGAARLPGVAAKVGPVTFSAPRVPHIELRWSRPRVIALAAAVAVLVVLILLATVGTDLLVAYDFFAEVHHGDVFTTLLWTRIVLFFVAALLGAVAVGANLVAAYLLRPAYVAPSPEQRQLEPYRAVVTTLRRPIVVAVTAVVGLIFGVTGQGRWATTLLFLHGQSFGSTDPQFHRDISYYTFTLPFERMVLGFLLAAVVVGLVLATLVHYLYGGIRLQVQGGRFSGAARAHLSVLLGLLLLLKSGFYWLDRFSLVFSDRGQVTGASYTDVHASIPAKTILVFVALICALLFFYNAIRPRFTIAAAGFITMALSALLIGGAFPFAVQQLKVKPNAINLESTYISRGITATRDAYRINPTNTPDGTVTTTSFDAPNAPVASAVTATAPNVANARLLDPNELQQTFEQLQQIRSYYSFPQALDIDRYTVGGQEQSYVIATRDVNLAGVQQKNWPNEHLVYTHGTGVVAAETSQVDANGRPVFAVKGVPATGSDGISAPPITLDQPRIYYGELSPAYSVVDTKQPEVDGTGAANYHYDGDGGVPVGSKLGTRLAMALHFRDYNLVFSSTLTKSSRIMYYRDPRQRVQKVAPWLTLDGDPYPAVIDGRIQWIVDGYTTTDDYPYSQRVSLSGTTTTAVNRSASNVASQKSTDINYIRNSVKATVDAYTGKVTLYAFEQGTPDPILRTWEKVFPGVITPESQIPSELRTHLRYPEDLFNIQRNLLAKYHVTDPKAFFNGNGFWQVANDPVSTTTAQASYYEEFQMPGESGPEFNLATSLTFNQRPNLAAFVAVSSDPSDYGTIRVLQLPDNTVINGPTNVENAIKSDPGFSPVFSLLNQQGSTVVAGNLLTLPVGGGLLFVQPFYTQAKNTSGVTNDTFPLLRYVVVVYGDKVGYAPTLAGAITAALSGGGGSTSPPPSTTGPTSPGPSASVTAPPAGTVAALQAAVSADFAAAAVALQKGDLGAYQAAVAKAQSDYQALLAAGGSAPASGSATIPRSGSPTPSRTP